MSSSEPGAPAPPAPEIRHQLNKTTLMLCLLVQTSVILGFLAWRVTILDGFISGGILNTVQNIFWFYATARMIIWLICKLTSVITGYDYVKKQRGWELHVPTGTLIMPFIAIRLFGLSIEL
jgi:hypothetical protein